MIYGEAGGDAFICGLAVTIGELFDDPEMEKEFWQKVFSNAETFTSTFDVDQTKNACWSRALTRLSAKQLGGGA